MQEKFKQWLISKGKKESTANSYSSSINKITEHYSKENNKKINIYDIQDINLLKKISKEYSKSGKFSNFGNNSNGTIRNAIARYVEYFTESKIDTIDTMINNKTEPKVINQNFSYERDLQISLSLQIDKLFPEYKIFGNNSEGIEYFINNYRIDILLEHKQTKDLLVIELKSGEAEYKVLGQISMYLGLLQEKFPKRKSEGIIIAGSINSNLKYAIKNTNNIKLKTYKINIELMGI